MEEERKEEKREEKKIKKKKTASGGRTILHILQHVLLTAAAVLTVFAILNSFLVITYADGKETYRLNGERAEAYEDSLLFNQMMGRGVKDAICFGAIRGQMETGSSFDGQKEVDVTGFANRYQGTLTEYITANYRLEDLIKWAQSGFEYDEVWMNGEEADQFLSRTSTVTVLDTDAYAGGTANATPSYPGGTVSYLNSDYKKITKVKDVSGNQFASGDYTREDTNARILRNRYLTTEGKGPEKYVSSWNEYEELCNHIEKAAHDLEINYGQYLVYQDEYARANTNLVYIIRKQIGKDVVVYSNLQTNTTDLARLEEQIKTGYGKYLIYDPMSMRYETNTLIEESAVRYLLNGYEYAYPQNTQVMIAVDTAFPIQDVFYQGAQHYRSYVDARLYYLGAIFCGVLYLILLVILTRAEGRVRRRDTGEIGIRLQAQDRIPTELMAVAGAIIGVGLAYAAVWAVNGNWNVRENKVPVLIFTGGMALLTSILFSFFYYSLIRRIKAGTLWKNSLIYRLWKGGRSWIKYVSEHGSLLLRVLLPFAVFAALQAFLAYLCCTRGRSFALLLLALDIAVGFLLYRSAWAREQILESIKRIKEGDLQQQVDESHLYGDNLVLARAVNSIGDSVRNAVETSMKDERLKADLITNVSHDIKTPLTSIINYVDLIKRENVQDAQVREYIEILDAKSQRLKQLTDDLVEASKISSGNIVLHMEKINLVELIHQSVGEFSEKFDQKGLKTVINTPQGAVLIEADSRRIWRVMENLFNNIFKYAMEGTRVYIDMVFSKEEQHQVILSVKNISAQPVNVRPEELTERFIRGDESRTTEGSGLGLSIARNLTEAQNGIFEIAVDGDLFKVYLTFPTIS